MSNCLILTGNEENHNYLVNSLINECKNYNFNVLKVCSRENNFEFYFKRHSRNMRRKDKKFIVDFIFQRNKTLCLKEKPHLLKSPKNQRIFNDSNELHEFLENFPKLASYDLVLTYSAPIIKNKKILNMKSFNLHFGLSRFYRGGVSNIMALAKNQINRVGVTCHKLEKKIDNGGALFELKLPSKFNFKNLDELNYYLLKKSTHTLIDHLNKNKFQSYTIPKGELIMSSALTSNDVLKAHLNILNSS